MQTGLMANEARTLNIGFIARMSRERPWVRAKIAASLDGKTALNNGTSQWITSEAARCDGHRLRARSCAILTGSAVYWRTIPGSRFATWRPQGSH